MREKPIAYDCDGEIIKVGDIVKVVENERNSHHWLRVGNTLRVSWWEDRSLGTKFTCVFLESKGEGKQCGMGIQDKNLKIVLNERILNEKTLS